MKTGSTFTVEEILKLFKTHLEVAYKNQVYTIT